MHHIHTPPSFHVRYHATDLVEWVGAGAPPCQEDGQTNSLEDAGKSADGNGVEWAFLSEDLCDELSKNQYFQFNFKQADRDSLPMEQS